MKETTKNSKKIYECSFMTLHEDDVVLENKHETKRVYIKHPGAAAILPITTDGFIILTRQYRYPISQISIEIPAGKKDDISEDPRSCAIRELEEETGYVSNHIQLLYSFYPCLGYSNEIIDLYIAYDCELIENPKSQDIDEFVETMLIKPDDAKHMLETDAIKDGKTIIALQKYFILLEKK